MIIRVINNSAYKLKLPESIKGVYPVFYPSLLYYDTQDPLPGQVISPPPPVYIDDQGGDYNALKVVDSKINKRRKDPVTGKRGYLIYRVIYVG